MQNKTMYQIIFSIQSVHYIMGFVQDISLKIDMQI